MSSYYGPDCPHCGSSETMGNRTPMNPEELAKKPYFCTDCRAKFNTNDGD